MAGTGGRRRAWTVCAIAAVAVVVLCASPFASALRDTPGRTHINDNRGRFVRIPASVPHTPGAYIDKRIRRNLIWLADHFRIYVTEGFAGRLPNGDRVGCPKCHVSHSEHKIGLAVGFYTIGVLYAAAAVCAMWPVAPPEKHLQPEPVPTEGSFPLEMGSAPAHGESVPANPEHDSERI